MDPLSVAASIIAVLQLSNKIIGYFNDVKDSSKERVKCALEASNLYSLLLNLRFRVEEGTADKEWYTAVRALTVENGPLDQFKEALETLRSKITDGGRLKHVSDALLWKFRKEEAASILSQIERLKSLVEIALQMDHFKLSQAIKKDIDIVREQVPIIQAGVNRIRQDQDTEKHRRLMDWISPTDYPSQQSDIIKNRQEGTCEWFLRAPEVKRWLSEANGTLFCPGIPGAGKTMVAAVAIDHLFGLVQQSSHGVAYVFCNYKIQEQDASSMLAAILKQLMQTRPSIVEPVERLHEQHAGRGTRPTLTEISSALRDVLEHYPTVYVVVDALDECRDSNGTRGQFLAKLRDLQAGRDLRLMATSRFIPEIMDSFEDAHWLEVRASQDDVKSFIAGQIYRLPRCIQHNIELQSLVEEKIVEAVDGMFLLARLHIDSLLDKRTPKDVKSTIARLSGGSDALEEAYSDALRRINSQLAGDCKLAKNVLSWVVHANRPLTTDEICCALAIEPGDTELDSDSVPDIKDMVSVCAGLVTVDEESDVIRLVHYTTQDYFESIRDSWIPEAQLRIATTCLTYLSFDDFKNGRCVTYDDIEERVWKNKFLDYAAKHWGEHAHAVEDEICELACAFLLNTESLFCAEQVKCHPLMVSVLLGNFPSATGLHCVAALGLSGIAKELICRLEQQGDDLMDVRDDQGQTPLIAAAENGHYEIAKLLINNGARVDARTIDGDALWYAIDRGHEQVVELLLNASAHFNGSGISHGTALLKASSTGHEKVVKLLLGSCVGTIRQEILDDALQRAPAKGREQIVKWLLDAGANVNAPGQQFGDALQRASAKGCEQIVKLLLDAGANVNAQALDGNALQRASAKGREQIVKLLLDAGANVNAPGYLFGNALQRASAKGCEQIVKWLLDAGANVNAPGRFGNALQQASAKGREQIVKLLLDAGAHVNASDDHLGSALEKAAARGHEQVVKVLVDAGADMNVRGRYGTVLQRVSACGNNRMVKILVDAGANVNAPGTYGNALQKAAGNGHEEVVKLLLDSGANINVLDGKDDSALSRASLGCRGRVVKLLLEAGSDVNAQGPSGSALQQASATGRKEVIKLLLDAGANVSAQGPDGNALQRASAGGHKQAVKLLIDAGAKVNAPGCNGNALQRAAEQGHEEVVKLLLDAGAVRP